MRKSAGKELKMFDKESVSLSLRNKDCSEHYGRRNCVKAKCPHKSTGIGCSGECDEPFFCKQVLHLLCDLPNDSFAEKCCKSLLFRRKNRCGAAFGFRDICACLVCRQVGAQHEKSCFELQFQGLSTEDIELSVSDSRICADLISNAERKMNSLTGGGNSSP